MGKAILIWLLKFALTRLGADVDAETRKQIDEYEQKRNALEAREKQSAIEIQVLEESIEAAAEVRNGYAKDLAEIEKQVSELDEKLGRVRNEKNKKLADLQSLTDDDLLHIEL